MADSEEALEEYFFPKFLTSPDLLELEVSCLLVQVCERTSR